MCIGCYNSSSLRNNLRAFCYAIISISYYPGVCTCSKTCVHSWWCLSYKATTIKVHHVRTCATAESKRYGTIRTTKATYISMCIGCYNSSSLRNNLWTFCYTIISISYYPGICTCSKTSVNSWWCLSYKTSTIKVHHVRTCATAKGKCYGTISTTKAAYISMCIGCY